MSDDVSGRELYMGIGFKTGILIAFVGLILMYAPLVYYGIFPYLDFIGFTYILSANPLWSKVATTGMVLVGGAFYVSILETSVNNHVDNLFFEDRDKKR